MLRKLAPYGGVRGAAWPVVASAYRLRASQSSYAHDRLWALFLPRGAVACLRDRPCCCLSLAAEGDGTDLRYRRSDYDHQDLTTLLPNQFNCFGIPSSIPLRPQHASPPPREKCFTASEADAGLFKAEYHGSRVYFLVYAVDTLVAAKRVADVDHVKARVTAIFDVREAKYFLGVSLARNRQA